MIKIGSLFSGYGGLDIAASAVLDGQIAWHSEIDPAASKILTYHWPNIPNHGDITTIDWTTVEPVDVIIGGFPCQDVSHAGKRAGLAPDTRSGLWAQMAHAINCLRPRLVIIENEWMMGLPDGHVTTVPGLSRNDQLKALGNGVVPQQAAAAITHLLAREVNV